VIFSFGEYQVDDERFVLRHRRIPVEVQPKVLELLLLLLRQRGRVVSQREIRAALWPDVAVTSSSIARAVSLARAVIGDRGGSPRAIVTVARRGYRFALPVRERPGRRIRRPLERPRRNACEVWEIVGRDAERGAVERLLADAGEGFAVLLIEGEAGVGKTTVFREALRRAEQHGFHVLACQPGASEVTLSFAALADLLGCVPPGKLAALPTPQRRAFEGVLLEAEPAERSVELRAAAAGMRSLLTGLALERPVLLALDDVQWLDLASAAALDFVLRRLGPERVGVLATRRLGEVLRLELEALPGGVLTRASMGPLSLGALQRLLKDRLGATFMRSTLVRIHATSRGNPLFALEIGRALAERPATPGNEPLPVPDDVRALVRERVLALPAATRELLLAAALLADPTAELLRRLQGVTAEADLEPAERAGIAALEGGAVCFTHPLHAAAVVAAATAGERRRMHMRLASAVSELEERAQHLALGSSQPDAAIARLLEAGAAAARSRGGLHAAAELLERARELTPACAVAEARGRGIRAAEMHSQAGDRARARSLLEELLAEPLTAAQRAEALRLLAELAFAEEDLPASEALLLEALAIAVDSATRARLQFELMYLLHHSNDIERSVEFGQRVLAELAGSDDGPLLAEAFAYTAIVDYLAGRGVDWSRVERAIQLEDPNRASLPGLPPGGVAALLQMYVGRHAESRARIGAICARLAEHGNEADLGHALLWRSWLETRSGNLALAAQIADEAITCTSLTATASIRRWALAQRAWVAAHLGEIDAARRGCAEAAAPERGGLAQVELSIAAALALVEVSLGHPEEVWRATRALTEIVEQHGIGEPVPLMFLPDTLAALVTLGELDRAESLLEAFERQARALDRSWALATGLRCRGLLLAERGDVSRACETLDQALAQHGRLDMPFERARTWLAQGVIERRARRRGRSVGALQQALAEFERMGARLFAERARQELARGGARPQAPGELTASERRAAELAAEGLSNKEIAAALFVGVHTVEVHLSHAYAKLGVHSRARLARALGPAKSRGASRVRSRDPI
jgi:DNA-binding winged helix-turn-helix (wHTH) protein/DNA-binding CsgD family transcriptional regulator